MSSIAPWCVHWYATSLDIGRSADERSWDSTTTPHIRVALWNSRKSCGYQDNLLCGPRRARELWPSSLSSRPEGPRRPTDLNHDGLHPSSTTLGGRCEIHLLDSPQQGPELENKNSLQSSTVRVAKPSEDAWFSAGPGRRHETKKVILASLTEQDFTTEAERQGLMIGLCWCPRSPDIAPGQTRCHTSGITWESARRFQRDHEAQDDRMTDLDVEVTAVEIDRARHIGQAVALGAGKP